MVGLTLSQAFLLLAFAALALALHCFTTYPLSLILFAHKRPAPRLRPEAAERPGLAICMCAYNEEQVIAAKAEQLLKIAENYGPATIHVYADAPSDRTVERLAPYADRIDLVVGQKRMGKTAGMNQLVERSGGDLILFTDANVMSDSDCAVELSRAFADDSVGCVTAHLVYSNRTESATSALGSLYWRLEEAIKRVESETVGVIGVDGAMFMIRRDLHRSPPPHLIDDLWLSLMILASGHRLCSASHVRIYERSAVGAEEERQRKRRIACQAANVHRALWGELRKLPPGKLYAYLSHRVMKWLSPFLLLASGLLALLAVAVAWGAGWAWMVLAALLGAVVIGHFGNMKPFSLVSSALFSLLGVAAGLLDSLVSGKTYTVWDPASSVRDAQDTVKRRAPHKGAHP